MYFFHYMKIFVAQINPTIGDFEGNTQKIIKALEHARAKKADIVLLPELAICGYPPEDLLYHPEFIEQMQKSLDKIVPATSNLLVFAGLVRRNTASGEKSLLNSVAIIENGKLIDFYDKCLLPTYDVFDERRYFEPGKKTFVYPYKNKKIAVTICEDIWQHAGYVDFTRYAYDPVVALKEEKPDVFLNLSASPYQFQKPDIRVQVCAKAAKTLRCPVIMCCQVGGNDQLIFDGYSVHVDEQGELRHLGKGFEEDEMLIDLDKPKEPFTYTYDPLKDLYSALVLGVRDYFRKQGFKKACLGLSGGIDSALVTCIAVDALGSENVLLVSMPSRYSSEGSIRDAEELARNLKVEFRVIPIETPFAQYLEILKPQFGNRPPDATEENLQARIRGMILMALSNKLGYIVLSTGNKSEMAMGFCTLYGDMCGGLGVIMDVTKGQVYALSRWINREKEIIPQAIIDKPPSAELRPDQKDIDTLPDYEVVDAVLQAYVEECKSAEEIASKYNYSLDLVNDLIHRIHLAEYKRRQAPPGIRVSKKSFRVGRRYPIVQKWR